MTNARSEGDHVAGVTYIVDPADPRVDDYRELNSIAVRAEMEGDEFFMGEGYVPIERMLDSGHRIRSVLLHPKRLNRFIPTMVAPNSPACRCMWPSRTSSPRSWASTCIAACWPPGSAHRCRPFGPRRSCRRLVVLEALNDDQNIGAIARAARAFGIDGIVISPTCNDPYQRRTVRVSMGEILHMPVARASADDWPAAIDTLHANGFRTWAMTPDPGAVDLWDLAVPDKLVIVLGAEGHGLEHATMAPRRVECASRSRPLSTR